MNEENSKLLENIMGALGENPSEKISQMLSALSGGNSSDERQEEQQAEDHQEPSDSGFGGFDLDMLMKMQTLMSQLGQDKPDERSTLLSAIRPFLTEERRPQIDQAIKLLKLSQLAQTARDMDLFKNLL